MMQSTSPEGMPERWANAEPVANDPAANDAAEPVRKLRRDRALMVRNTFVRNSWFAIGFTLHRDECVSCAILGRTSG